MLDRRQQVNRMHDHLKPNKVCWDDDLEVILKMQEKFMIWIKEVTRTSGHDPEYVFTGQRLDTENERR